MVSYDTWKTTPPDDGEPVRYEYEVFVGNIGTVTRTDDLDEALADFTGYASASVHGVGRAAGECVTLTDAYYDVLAMYEPPHEDEETGVKTKPTARIHVRNAKAESALGVLRGDGIVVVIDHPSGELAYYTVDVPAVFSVQLAASSMEDAIARMQVLVDKFGVEVSRGEFGGHIASCDIYTQGFPSDKMVKGWEVNG